MTGKRIEDNVRSGLWFFLPNVFMSFFFLLLTSLAMTWPLLLIEVYHWTTFLYYSVTWKNWLPSFKTFRKVDYNDLQSEMTFLWQFMLYILQYNIWSHLVLQLTGHLSAAWLFFHLYLYKCMRSETQAQAKKFLLLLHSNCDHMLYV